MWDYLVSLRQQAAATASSFTETTLSIHTEIQRQGYEFYRIMITQRML